MFVLFNLIDLSMLLQEMERTEDAEYEVVSSKIKGQEEDALEDAV